MTYRMVFDARHQLVALGSVERRRLKTVGGHENQAAALLARMTLGRGKQLAAKPPAARRLRHPEVRNVTAAAPRVTADTSVHTPALFPESGE
jgi:hypothetical protein